ncbi:MAG: tyrosine-type recombinase/integrase [Gammaproteobacteria bacterium]|nr:tyrosine-type recombinase/integrase [Gammaproteobacteria bacterium]
MSNFDEFKEHLVSADRSPATIRAYLADMRGFTHWFEQTNGQTLTIQTATPTDIKEYRQYLLVTKGFKAATVNRKLAAINAWLKWGLDFGLIDHNPAMRIKWVEQQPLAPKWLIKKDAYRVVRWFEERLQTSTSGRRVVALRNLTIVKLILNSGLRAGEVCALTLGDITIRARKGDVNVRGKGRKQRTIPLNKIVREALNDWLEVREAADHRNLFMSGTGLPLETSAIRRFFAKAQQATGIEVTAHILRHTFAKRLRSQGVSLEQVSTLLGHSSIDTTAIYTVPSRQDLTQAVETLE